LVSKGVKLALLSDGHLLNGLNVHQGMITYEAIARDLGYEYVAATDALAS
jgi:alanine dehydrogenase